jgi:hypothetical protein
VLPREGGSSKLQIPGLSFGDIRVIDLPAGAAWASRAEIRLFFHSPNGILESPSGTLRALEGSEYELLLNLSGASTPFELVVPGSGTVEAQGQSFVFVHPGLQSLNAFTSRSAPIFQLGIGMASMSYSETHRADFSQLAMTVQAGASISLLDSKDLELGLDTHFTALPFEVSISGVGIRFFGADATVGYRWLALPSGWSSTIGGGAYYETTITAAKPYGFRDMWGPMFTPTVSKELTPDRALSLYGRLAPLSFAKEGHLSGRNRRLAAGLAFSWGRASLRPWVLGLDYSQVDLEVQSATVLSRAYSLNLGLAF